MYKSIEKMISDLEIRGRSKDTIKNMIGSIRGTANISDKTHINEYSSINLRFGYLNISLRNSHFISDFQFQTITKNKVLKQL